MTRPKSTTNEEQGMGEVEQQQAPGDGPPGVWQPFLEFRFRWDAGRRQHVITKRGMAMAPSWEECPDVDFLVVATSGRNRLTAVEVTRMLNGQRTPEQVPGKAVGG